MDYFNHAIEHLTLEVTTRCILRCSECSRNSCQYQQEPSDIDILILNNLFTTNLLESLYKNRETQVTLCGNYGDPIYHPHFHKIIQFIKERKLSIELITNGSHRSKEWWQKTIELLDEKDKVIFSIDGDESSNHIYRQGSDWDSLVTAVKIASAKCHTTWKCIAFEHNIHQLEQLKAYAKDLGMDQFMINYSGRASQIAGSIFAAKGALAGAKLKNKQAVKKTYKSYHSKSPLYRFLWPLKINLRPQCRYGREIYLSAEGILLPCCSAALYPSQPRAAALFNEHKDHFDLKKFSIDEIIQSKKLLLLEKATSSAKKAPYICIKRCGVIKNQIKPEELKRDDQLIFEL